MKLNGNNNKTANNMERRFALYKPENADEPIVEIVDGELNIYFTYELVPKATKQDALREAAMEAIKPLIPEGFEELQTVKAPTAKEPNRTLLEKHLTDYTAKNSFDYFIHKDLGGFLPDGGIEGLQGGDFRLRIGNRGLLAGDDACQDSHERK
jgi:adenine-specific DNA-methyltransferase